MPDPAALWTAYLTLDPLPRLLVELVAASHDNLTQTQLATCLRVRGVRIADRPPIAAMVRQVVEHYEDTGLLALEAPSAPPDRRSTSSSARSSRV